MRDFKGSFSPLSVGIVHFIGIGGIGMSGIAEIMHTLGYTVQGSDLAENANVLRLRARGIEVFVGHRAEHLGQAGVVVISSAVKKDNPEVIAAREATLPIVRRADMLGELMRFKWAVAVGGTHGKTTTTSMVAAMFEAADLKPTVVSGGIINECGTNAYVGNGDWMVVESDESDGSFTRLPATVAIVTNIDPEHMDHYRDFEAVRQAYATFVENIPFYGFAVMCLDHPEVQTLIARIQDRRVITYGLSPQAEVTAINIRSGSDGFHYDAVFTDRQADTTVTEKDMYLPTIGMHNLQNSLAVLATAWGLGLPPAVMRQGLARFAGVKRRFTKTGVAKGITVIDDYGHHPVEIAATLRAARQAVSGGNAEGRIIAVVQPHRYSRLSSLFNGFCTCFNDADAVIVAEVYPAGEEPIDGASRDALVDGLRACGHRDVMSLESPAHLAALVSEIGQAGDYVVCFGAGNITQWAYALPQELEKLG